jgi:hypothetical protein
MHSLLEKYLSLNKGDFLFFEQNVSLCIAKQKKNINLKLIYCANLGFDTKYKYDCNVV